MKFCSVWGLVVMVGVSCVRLPFSEAYSNQNQINKIQAAKCIQAACGSFEGLPTMTRIQPGMKTESAQFSELWKTEIERQIKSHYHLEKSLEAQILENFQANLPGFIEQFQAEGSANPFVRVAYLVYYMSGWSDYMQFIKELKSPQRFVVDTKKLKFNFPGEKLSYREAVLREVVIPRVLESQDVDPFHVHFDQKSGLLAHRLKMRFGESLGKNFSVIEALKRDSEQLMRIHGSVHEVLGDTARLLIDGSSEVVIQKAILGYDFSEAEAKIYLEVSNLIELFYTALLVLPEPNAEDLHSEMSQAIEDYYRAGVQGRRVNVLPEEQVLGYCRSQLSQLEAVRQSEQHLNEFRLLIPEVKMAVTTVIQRMVPRSAHAHLKSVVNQIQVFLPVKPRAEIPEFLREMNAQMRNFEVIGELLRDGHVEEILWLYLMKATTNPERIYDNTGKTVSYLSCEKLPILPSADVADPASGRITLSWFAVKFRGHGMGILAHEIAHILSPHLRRAGNLDLLNRSLSCLVSRNPYAESTPVFLEEDWADYFSARVMRELQKKDSLSQLAWGNFACGLLRSQSADDLDLQDLEPVSGVSHSPALIRILNFAHDFGEMPSACRPLASWMESRAQFTPLQKKQPRISSTQCPRL